MEMIVQDCQHDHLHLAAQLAHATEAETPEPFPHSPTARQDLARITAVAEEHVISTCFSDA